LVIFLSIGLMWTYRPIYAKCTSRQSVGPRKVPEARLVFGSPAVRDLGTARALTLRVKVTGDVEYGALLAQGDKLTAQGNQQPGLVGLFSGSRARTPQLYVDVDREKVKATGVPLSDISEALQAYLGRREPLQPHVAGGDPRTIVPLCLRAFCASVEYLSPRIHVGRLNRTQSRRRPGS
jgi:multidrug efflux pump subunit AcrB